MPRPHVQVGQKHEVWQEDCTRDRKPRSESLLSFAGIVTLVKSLSLSGDCQNADEKETVDVKLHCQLYCKYNMKISCYCKNQLNFFRDARGIFLGAEKFVGEYAKEPAH